jgi:hypothetical protein
VLDFAGGHPLALSLAAEAALDGDSRDGPTRTVTRDVMDSLLPQLVGAVLSGTHRLALQVCAHSYLTTEHLLAAVLVREALEFDMRRDRIGYEVMHRRNRHYVLGTLVSRQADQATTLTTMRAVRHLRRGGGVVPRYITASGGSDVEASGLRLEDHDALITMAASYLVLSRPNFWRPLWTTWISVRCRASRRWTEQHRPSSATIGGPNRPNNGETGTSSKRYGVLDLCAWPSDTGCPGAR